MTSAATDVRALVRHAIDKGYPVEWDVLPGDIVRIRHGFVSRPRFFGDSPRWSEMLFYGPDADDAVLELIPVSLADRKKLWEARLRP